MLAMNYSGNKLVVHYTAGIIEVGSVFSACITPAIESLGADKRSSTVFFFDQGLITDHILICPKSLKEHNLNV